VSGDRLVAASTRLYRGLLSLYPTSFRSDWGGEMLSVFRDLSSEAVGTSGPRGLIPVWRLIALDLALSLPRAYRRTGRGRMRKLVTGAAAMYLTLLVAGVGIGALAFNELYERPGFTAEASPEASEAELARAYETALAGRYGTYRTFARILGFGVAVALGFAAGLFGVWQRSVWHGAVVFGFGVGATLVALAVLPSLYFPFDRYPVAGAWVIGGPALVAAACWLLVTVAGRRLPGPAHLVAT